MLVFATNFKTPYFYNLYLSKNNSLITFFNINTVVLQKGNNDFLESLNMTDLGVINDNLKITSLNSNNKNLFPLVIDLGFWFFNQSFGYKIKNYFLYLTKSLNFFSLVSRSCLLYNYLSKFGIGYRISCTLVGVGYKVLELNENFLILKLGRSYQVKYLIPKLINLKVFGKRKTKIRFFSSDVVKLMTSVYLFRLLRWPDVYKGKGIKLTKQKTIIKFREKFGSIHYKNKK